MRIAWIVLFMVLGIVPSAKAQEWSYLGRIDTAYFVNGVQMVASDPPSMLVAIPRTGIFPGSGGIYRHQGSDSGWQRVGLTDLAVGGLERPENLPGRIFAPTDFGVYESTDEGMTWDLFPTVDDPVFRPAEFKVSPLDSTLWILGLMEDIGGGKLYVTTNSGGAWRLAYHSGSHWAVFSRHLADRIYFDWGGYFYRASLTDSSIEAIHACREMPFLTGIVGHPTEPWIYCVWMDTLLRYDEMTGERLFHTISPDITPANSMVVDPRGGLWIGAEHGIYHVSDDTETWEQIETPFPDTTFRVGYANDTLLVAVIHDDHYQYDDFYARVRPEIASPPRPPVLPNTWEVTVFPNPCNGWPSVWLSPDWFGRGEVEVEVYNLLGQKVWKRIWSPSGGERMIQSARVTYVSGMYVVKVN
jgi:hypothetical protein